VGEAIDDFEDGYDTDSNKQPPHCQSIAEDCSLVKTTTHSYTGAMNSEDPIFLERRAIAEGLGRLVLVWTHIETTSHIMLWGVIDPLRGIEECRLLTIGQSLDWVWNTTQALLSRRAESDSLVEWFKEWNVRATEGRRKRNKAVHAWWLPTGDSQDPYKALEFVSRKSLQGIREDVVPGGSATLLKWIEEISVISEDQLRWMNETLMPFLARSEPSPSDS
jgi:hypothetical protein